MKRINGNLFPLGRTMMTPGVRDSVPPETILWALHEHSNGRWGELDDHDRQANERAVKSGDRILSAYTVPGTDVRFWIITEWDRSATTVLLPEEY